MNRERMLLCLQQGIANLAALPGPGPDVSLLQRRLRGAMASLSQPCLRVGVFGITSSGKSALINAFVGEPLLPEQSAPSSNVPVVLRAGAQRTLTVHRTAPGAQPESVPATAASLVALGTLDGNPDNCKAISQLELTLPGTLIPPGLELADSQGLGAGDDRTAEMQVRLAGLPRADIVLYLLAGGRFSRLDREFLRELQPDQPVICVMTGADRYPAAQLDAAGQELQAYLPGAPDWAASGFPDLLAALDSATRQVWESRTRDAAATLAEVANRLRPWLASRLADARAACAAEQARYDQIRQSEAQITAARADLESEIDRLAAFTPVDSVLEPLREWLGRLQVAQSTLDGPLRDLQKRLHAVPETYRSHVAQRLAALAAKYIPLAGLKLAEFPEVPHQPALTCPTTTIETKSAFGLLKQKTVMVLMPELQAAVEQAVQTAVAPLRAHAARELRAWEARVLDDRLAAWKRALPETATRLASSTRAAEQWTETERFWEPFWAQFDLATASTLTPVGSGLPAMAALVRDFSELALPRLLLRAVHDVAPAHPHGRRRVLITGADFAVLWKLAQLLLRQRAEPPAPPALGLLWLQPPDRHEGPPFPCQSHPQPAHRLLGQIDLILAASGANPGPLAAAAQWADAVIVAAPAREAATAIGSASQASWAAKAILLLSEAGAAADRLPELAATLLAWRGAAILHDQHDVRYTHFLKLAASAGSPASLVRLWRAWRLRPGVPFDPADLQGYFAEILADREGVNA